MNEKIKNATSRVKEHIKEHKVAYIAGTAGVAAGVVITLAIKSDVKITGIIIGKNNTLVQTTLLARRGHPGFVVRCNETGELFASLRRAAEAMNLNPGDISKHLAGVKDHVGGFTFENLGEAK